MINIKNREIQFKKLDELKNKPFYEEVKQLYFIGKIKTITTAKKYITQIKTTKKGQIDKRTNKKLIETLLKDFSNKPLYEEVNKLYKNNIITAIEAINYLKNIKLTKKGQIDKRTSKILINLINKSEIVVFEKNIIGKTEIKIDEALLNLKYNQRTHFIQFQKMKKLYPNKLYKQTVKFYNDKDELINKMLSFEDEDTGKVFTANFKNREFIPSKPNKNFYNKIYFEMTDNGDFDYMWLCDILVRFYGEDNYSIITTEAIETVKNIEKIGNIQEYQNNDTGTCVYDAFLKYFKSSNDKNAKTVYNRLISEEGLKYKKSYNNDNLKEICNYTNSSLYIRDIVKGKEHDKIIKTDFARFKINMVNSKYNHLDLLLGNDEIKEVNNYKELEKVKEDNKFYVEKFGTVQTLDTIYKVKDDDFKITFKEWKKKYKLSNKYIFEESYEDKMLDNYDYILHTFFNKWNIENEDYKEIDLKKAYYNYSDIKYNKFYHGVPSGKFINMKCNDDFKIETFNEITENLLSSFTFSNSL